MTSQSPPYAFPTPDTPSPNYSRLPGDGEETISRFDLGTFVRRWNGLTLALKDQPEKTSTPQYSSGSLVRGEIQIDRQNASEIAIMLEGELALVSPAGSSKTRLVSLTSVLFRSDGSPNSRPPKILPFSITFPSSYLDGQTESSLPPSFDAKFLDESVLVAKSSYTLTVVLNDNRALLTSKQDKYITPYPQTQVNDTKNMRRFTLPLEYHPNSSDAVDFSGLVSPFIHSVKNCPQAWHEEINCLEPRIPHASSSNNAASMLRAIDCHVRGSTLPTTRLCARSLGLFCQVFVPSATSYGIDQEIPVHVQLGGHPTSIRTLYSQPRSPTLMDAMRRKKPTGQTFSMRVQVHICRRVAIVVNNRRTEREYIIGEGKVKEAPPPFDGDVYAGEVCTLDWDGQVSCGSGVTTGGFNTRSLSVQDYILVIVTPAGSAKSAFKELQVRYPVNFVTT